MERFKDGDRFKVIKLTETAVRWGISLGDEGTILSEGIGGYFVRMDKFNPNLHNCHGQCEHAHGLWINEENIVKILGNTENWDIYNEWCNETQNQDVDVKLTKMPSDYIRVEVFKGKKLIKSNLFKFSANAPI